MKYHTNQSSLLYLFILRFDTLYALCKLFITELLLYKNDVLNTLYRI